jgi:nucleoside-diphosphate-sugar epimerase
VERWKMTEGGTGRWRRGLSPREQDVRVARALVTGATGYIGGRVARHLLDVGWRVHAVVRPDSERRRLPGAVVCHVHDQSAVNMARIVRDAAPDVVFHLASQGQTQPRHSVETLDNIVAANIGFGAQLLDAMESAGAHRLIEAGTNWEFDAAGHFRPNNFYAATKQAFRVLANYYVQRYGFSTTTLLLYDVYGPDDWRGKFLSHLVSALKRNETMAATPGEQIVEFVHVDDVAHGFLVAAQELMRADARPALRSYRLDSGRRLALREASALMTRLAGRPECVRFGGRPYPPEQIMEPLAVGPRPPGWGPEISLEQGFLMLLSEAGLAGSASQLSES